LGTLIAWATEASARVADGTAWDTAILEAAELTAIPYACPRLADGRLEAPAVQMLREQIGALLVEHNV
jgi:hypothetical protein